MKGTYGTLQRGSFLQICFANVINPLNFGPNSTANSPKHHVEKSKLQPFNLEVSSVTPWTTASKLEIDI